jgi:hypothetical protein
LRRFFGGGCPELTGRLQGKNPTFSFPSQAALLNSRSCHNVADHRDVDVHTLNAGPVSNRYKHLFFHHGADVLDGPKINASLQPADASCPSGRGVDVVVLSCAGVHGEAVPSLSADSKENTRHSLPTSNSSFQLLTAKCRRSTARWVQYRTDTSISSSTMEQMS